MKKLLAEWLDSETVFVIALVVLMLVSCVASIVESHREHQKEKARSVCPTCGQKGELK